MRISFIGMTGSGKSYWSQKLQQKGYKIFCCDDLIEEKLGSELKKLGYSGIKDVAKWMGQPFEPQHKLASKKYLQFEKEVLLEIFAELEKSPHIKNVVIDTTGSVVYMDEFVHAGLKKFTTVLYFQIPDSVKDEMYQLYLKDPKPVIWGAQFRNFSDDPMKALAESYPKLLSYRTKKYEKLADMTFDYHTLRNPQFTPELFLQMLEV